MRVTKLVLQNFRNFEDAEFFFDAATNCIWGENGVGKSNLLEAIFFAATGRSPKATRDGELIRFDQDIGRVEARTERRGSELILEATLERIEPLSARKSLKINRQPIRKLSELIGQIKVVLFTPEDEAIVQGEPSRRRRFLDLMLSQMSAKYLHYLQQYHNVKEQRNSLLKRPHSSSELTPWNLQLIESGSFLLLKRLELIPKLDAVARAFHAELSAGKETLSLAYLPSFPMPTAPSLETLRGAFECAIANISAEETRRGTTLVGPHRDDFGVMLDQVDARLFGSQGQQKTAALSLKLAEGELFTELDEETPLYLLDDCFSELDSARQEAIQLLLGSKAQTFLTFAVPPPQFLIGSKFFELPIKQQTEPLEKEVSLRNL